MQSVPITTNIVSLNPAHAMCTWYNWLAAGRQFFPGTPAFFTNKTDRHYITEILLKVALNTTILQFCSRSLDLQSDKVEHGKKGAFFVLARYLSYPGILCLSGPRFPMIYRYMSWSILCPMIWGEWLLFIMLILGGIVDHHCFLS